MISSNTAALALYEKLGYEHLRDLEIWSLEGAPAGTARDVPAAEAHARVRGLRRGPEPWQREDVVLERALAAGEPRHGLVAEGGAAVLRVTAQGVVVEQIAARDAAVAEELLGAALRLGWPVRLTNVPEGDPVGEAFRELGGSLDLRQHELRLAL